MMNGRTITCGGYHFKYKRRVREYSEEIVCKSGGPANQSDFNLKVVNMDGGIVGFHAQ
jgi:hypothetical protein